MLKNYFKIALRSLLRNKIFSVIKIAGLSIGLAVCILILLFTKDEISYDRFHENKDRLFRIIQTWEIGKDESQSMGITNSIIGKSFAKEIPEVQQYVRINGVPITMKKENNVFTENALFVDDNFLSIFTFPLLKGSRSNALNDLHAVVLSKEIANKYFPQDAAHGTTDIIGKTIQIKVADEFENFTVTAIAENSPENSSLKIEMLLPIQYYEKYNSNQDWIGGSLNTFLLLSPKANIKTVESKMQSLFDKNTKDDIAKMKEKQGMDVRIKLALQPLTNIHLGTGAGPDNGMINGSKPAYSYILTCIAAFILIIACINFINLAVAQSLKRSKEIGIRKVVGSSRMQLIKQFLIESFIVSLIAFAFAFFLTVIILPFFNELSNKKLSLSYLSDGYLYAGLFLLLLITSFVAGFYPSIVLSSFQPVKVLYNRQKLTGKNYLTKGLIVLQFSLAIFLIIGTIAVTRQLNFLFHANLGYDNRNLVQIKIPVSSISDRLPGLFKDELANKGDVISVAAKNGGRSISLAKVDGKNITIENVKIDDRFLPTFKIPIIAGRNFSPDYPSDSIHAIIVNESFVKEAGWKNSDAVGKTVAFVQASRKPAMVVGVVKDYHFTSLKEKISPEVFSMLPEFNFGEIWVKVKPDNIPKTLAMLQDSYKKLVPYFPYSYQFMDDINAKNYETESKWKQMISIAAVLFIFIACMGLLGLVMLSVEQRKKEIGIRKVLGAAISKIVTIIAKDFVLLVSFAFVIAAPLGYWAVNKWLESFPYRINMSWSILAASGFLVIAVAMLTISVHAIKAAIANPVKSLRTE